MEYKGSTLRSLEEGTIRNGCLKISPLVDDLDYGQAHHVIRIKHYPQALSFSDLISRSVLASSGQ